MNSTRINLRAECSSPTRCRRTMQRERWSPSSLRVLSVTVKWLALKTASEMTYTVSGGALNSTQSNPIFASCRSLLNEKAFRVFPFYRQLFLQQMCTWCLLDPLRLTSGKTLGRWAKLEMLSSAEHENQVSLITNYVRYDTMIFVSHFWQRVSIACYAERCLSHDRFCPSDRLTVRLSQSGIMPKRLQLRSCGLHWRIAPWLWV